jgi:hypothetical protein
MKVVDNLAVCYAILSKNPDKYLVKSTQASVLGKWDGQSNIRGVLAVQTILLCKLIYRKRAVFYLSVEQSHLRLWGISRTFFRKQYFGPL